MSVRPSAPEPAPLGGKPAAALAVGCGLLYFLAFPGLDLWPLSFFAFVPLVVALHGQTARRAAWLGWLAGFTMTMIGFYWLLDMLQNFSGFPTPLCVIFMGLLCGYQSGRIAFMAWLAQRISERGFSGRLAFVLGFVASEQAFPLLFPWSYAATVHQVPALTQIAEVGGPILVALPIVAANLALGEIALAWRAQRVVRWKLVAALAAAPVVSALYGAVRIPSVDAATEAAPKGRVGLVQANMSLQGKRLQKGEGLRRHLTLTRELKEKGKLDLVVWSETSVMSSMDEEEIAEAVPSRFASSLGVPTLFGAVIVKRVDDARRYILYNSALLTDERGEVMGRFDKQRLVMFSESMPFGEEMPILYEWSPNSGKFVPGTRYEPLTVGSHQIATIICYEDIIASFVNRIVNNGNPDLLANLTNDAWFGDTTEPWIHLAMAKLRAVEHRRFFVRSTNSGVSAIIDPVGRVLVHTEPFRQEAIAGEIAWLHASTVYETLGDIPWWLLTLGALGLAFRRRPPTASALPAPTTRTKTKRSKSGHVAESAAIAAALDFQGKAHAWLRRQSGDSARDVE